MSIADQVKDLQLKTMLTGYGAQLAASVHYDAGSSIFLMGAVNGSSDAHAAKANLRQLFYSFVRTYATFMRTDGKNNLVAPEELFADVTEGVSLGLARYANEHQLNFPDVTEKSVAIAAKKWRAP